MRQLQILMGHPLRGIEQQTNQIGTLNRPQARHHAEFFEPGFCGALFFDAGCIDQNKFMALFFTGGFPMVKMTP